MLSRKTMIKGQKMRAYLEFYDFLIGKRLDYYIKYIQTKKIKYLKQSKEIAEMLIETTRKALNDKNI